MFLHIMIIQTPKQSNVKKIIFFNFICYDVKNICTKNHMSQCIQKLIEIIFNLYEIYNVY
jgi:hypothetical protein